ncbi:UNVERIFIED_CONTAM: hypothetical protein FKN15_031121 [Acipenser sinensis]
MRYQESYKQGLKTCMKWMCPKERTKEEIEEKIMLEHAESWLSRNRCPPVLRYLGARSALGTSVTWCAWCSVHLVHAVLGTSVAQCTWCPVHTVHTVLSAQVRRVKCSEQVRDIIYLKEQMAQVLELLSRQQAPAAPVEAQAPLPPAPDSAPGSLVEAGAIDLDGGGGHAIFSGLLE